MKSGVKILTILIAVLPLFVMNHKTAYSTENKASSDYFEPTEIMAINDTFYFVSGCGNLSFAGNVIDNDDIPAGKSAQIQYIISSEKQFISFGRNGNFVFKSKIGFNGTVRFNYYLVDENNIEIAKEATVYIQLRSDNDCDGVFDIDDIDDDNDGIPDMAEGNGQIDTDNDGILDIFDIDDDNDGIPDTREWQSEENYIVPSGIDENANGWDDVFEKEINPYKFVAIDSDNDKIPDFLDDDSDNDEISDFIEATDANFDNFADFNFIYSDNDFDGLDDAFDNVRYWLQECNSTGSCVPIPDHNSNGVSDYRENLITLEENEKNKKDVFIEFSTSKITFPNPTNGLFSVNINDFSTEIETHIKIYGLNGDLKADIIPTQSIVDLDLTSFNSGIYVLKIVTPNLSCAKKLVLQNL